MWEVGEVDANSINKPELDGQISLLVQLYSYITAIRSAHPNLNFLRALSTLPTYLRSEHSFSSYIRMCLRRRIMVFSCALIVILILAGWMHVISVHLEYRLIIRYDKSTEARILFMKF